MTSWDFWWFFCFLAVTGIPGITFMWHDNEVYRWRITITVALVVVLIVTFLSMMGTIGGR